MEQAYLLGILNQVADGSKTPEDAMESLKELPYTDLGFAKIDQHRNIRTGYPEAIFCQGKTTEQIVGILSRMMENNVNILGTRASDEVYQAVRQRIPQAIYYPQARIILVQKQDIDISEKIIAVVTAGTADIPVAEEAAVTAEILGNRVERIYDVGVAGIHRLLAQAERIQKANVVIVVAGMEGALASVVGGLVDKPVIAVPTSVGYGASFGGISALLTMLNSCASGVAVVNIDNGFGAAYFASNVNKLRG